MNQEITVHFTVIAVHLTGNRGPKELQTASLKADIQLSIMTIDHLARI